VDISKEAFNLKYFLKKTKLIYFSIYFVLLLLSLKALVQSNPITTEKTQHFEATKYTIVTQRSDPTKRTEASRTTIKKNQSYLTNI